MKSCTLNTSKLSSLNIYYQNVRGLNTKIVNFYLYVCSHNFDIIVLTETWLHDGVLSSELFDDRYVVYRRDRYTSGFHSFKSGGGVLVAVNKKLNSRSFKNFESDCEDLWVGVDIFDNKKKETLLICAAYLPPPVQSHMLNNFITNANKSFDNTRYKLILGDFNLSNITWDETNSPFTSSELSNLFLDFINLHDLKQWNNILNNKSKILDLILSNVSVVNVSSDSNGFCSIDPLHPPLEFCVSVMGDKEITLRPARPNFFKADYCTIISELNKINWNDRFNGDLSVDEMLDIFYATIDSLIRIHVPISRPKNKNYPPWFTKELISLLKEKYKCHLKVKKYNNPLDKMSFQLLRDRCFILQNNCYKSYTARLEASLKHNPKLFWSHVKIKNKNKNAYPSQMHYEQRIATNGNDICNLFASNFSSIYDQHASNFIQVSQDHASNSNYLLMCTISHKQIVKIFKSLDVYKSAGCDNIPPVFIVRCAEPLSYPVEMIYRKSLSSGVFPARWKQARVVPIYKSGDRHMVNNYRPISILPTLGKVFEKLISRQLTWHLKQYMSDNQHGFLSKRSTATNLVSFIDSVIKDVDSRSSVDVIYADFSKAFDLVNHSILLKKLATFGIGNNLLKWCGSYLSNRSASVVINGCNSSPYTMTTGVPQGSHLGPILFNVFINDIPDIIINSQCFLFADDLKLSRRVDNPNEAFKLQEDLDSLSRWCKQNHMTLNTNKCYHIRFSRKKHNCCKDVTYRIDDIPLKQVQQIRDLGILLDSELRFDTHIDKITSKAFKTLGFILRNTKEFRQPDSIILLYNALVRSCLEYCCVAWNPHYKKYIDRIERLQKKFLKILSYRLKLRFLDNYNSRLKHFNMTSLEERRRSQDLIFLYKIVNGMLDCPQLLRGITFNMPSRLPRSGNYRPFVTSRTYSKLGRNSPLNRLLRQYNTLISSDHRIDIFGDTIIQFKKYLTSKL